jgi:N-methylhydantoinase A
VIGDRQAVFGGDEHTTQVVRRDLLRPGDRQPGPAVIEEDGSTTVVPPGWAVDVDEHGNLLVREEN